MGNKKAFSTGKEGKSNRHWDARARERLTVSGQHAIFLFLTIIMTYLSFFCKEKGNTRKGNPTPLRTLTGNIFRVLRSFFLFLSFNSVATFSDFGLL